jgi:Beta-lactamase
VRARLAVEPETVFPIGSITKQFTAAAIMLLVRDRRIDLDAKAADYVPLAPHGTEYTVRQLLLGVLIVLNAGRILVGELLARGPQRLSWRFAKKRSTSFLVQLRR